MAASRGIRNRKPAIKPDFVYTLETDKQEHNVSSSPAKMNKKEQLVWMRSNLEKLIVDKSLQLDGNGKYTRDFCDIKFCTERFDEWLKVCADNYRDRSSTNQEKGATKFHVSDTKGERYVTVNFYPKNNLVMIQGKAKALHAWIKHDLLVLQNQLVLKDENKLASDLSQDQNIVSEDQSTTNNERELKTKVKDLDTVEKHTESHEITEENVEISALLKLDGISLNDSILDTLFTSFRADEYTENEVIDVSSLEEEYVTIDALECSLYEHPQESVQKLKDFESLSIQYKQLQNEKDSLIKRNIELSQKLAHASSRNIALQQEVSNQKSYIRQLMNEHDSMSATIISLNGLNFESPMKTAKPKSGCEMSRPFNTPNRFDLLSVYNPQGSPECLASTPITANMSSSIVNKGTPLSQRAAAPNIFDVRDFPKLPSSKHGKPASKNSNKKSLGPIQDKDTLKITHHNSTKPRQQTIAATATSTEKCGKTTTRKTKSIETRNVTSTAENTAKSTNNVVIIGDSMVRGSATSFNERAPSRYRAMTFTHPGASIERLTHGMVGHKRYDSTDPGYLILHTGTNNVQRDDFLTTKLRFGDLMEEARVLFPNSKLFVSGLIPRKDLPYLNKRIHYINAYLAKMCSKSPHMYFVDNSQVGSCVGKDGLHLNHRGKDMLAKNFLVAISSFQEQQRQKKT